MNPTILDRYGNEQSWQWLESRFGPLVIHPAIAGPGWRCVEIRENADPQLHAAHELAADIAKVEDVSAAAVILVTLLNPDGSPFPNHRVGWYGPGAPQQPDTGPLGGFPEGMTPGCSYEPGVTNGNGHVGFAMGGGAYYFPPDRGPHAVWAYGPGVNSDVVFGLGMLGGTNHDSLWPTFQWTEEGDEPPPEPTPPEAGTLRQALADLEAAIAAIRQALG